LIITTFRALKWPLLATVFPRICLLGFNFAQPFLIARSLTFLSQPQDELSKREGSGLIGAALLIYLGLAVFSAHYEHRLYRTLTMFRGAMVAVIYDHSLKIDAETYNESAALTLMSTDVDRVAGSITDFHEVWARSMEIAIGLTLLALQIGWVSVIPLVVVASK
jgi:ATP-binding cassette, subfamily C (CFTR/MRP), member 1